MQQCHNLPLLAPPSPSYVDTTVGSTAVGVAWDDGAAGYAELLSYKLTFDGVLGREQKGCEGYQHGSAVTNNTEYVISGLTEYTTYNVTIVGENLWGTSEPRSQLITTLSSGKEH